MNTELNSLKQLFSNWYSSFNKLTSVQQTMFLIGVPVGLFFIAIVSYNSVSLRNNSSKKYSSSSSSTSTVEYQVSGSARYCSINYTNAQGGSEMESDVTIPHTIKAGSMKSGSFVYISAQNGEESGSVTVSILIDGKIYKESSSKGAYVIATASGSVE